MEQFSVSRTDREDLTFEGDLVSKATSAPHVSEIGTRYFELALYSQPSGSQPSGSQPSGSQPSGSQPSGSQPSGEFVVTIEFKTDSEGESNFSQAEMVEESKDVENVLFAFEPAEFVDRRKMHSITEDARRKFQKELFHVYDGAVNQILDSLTIFTAQDQQPAAELSPANESPANESPANESPASESLASESLARRGLLGFRGRKS